ncbi:hypothetical protein P171DRAFT_474436 [Karstenula rhodostoma CBS 690.94]|uniref:Uncharacterized protein n=1 Tax=Karstenula rhodostoma CBS 690.94 TaxID=1392251 RepID=A0A9P4PHR3_9PLEO|nr:hypothetical protein P171DRAFT_474436 [Karstenula rhodostoma CBS 690.94]
MHLLQHLTLTLLALFTPASTLASNASVSSAPTSNLTALTNASAPLSNPSPEMADLDQTADPIKCIWAGPNAQYCKPCGKDCAGIYIECKKWKCPVNSWGCSKVCYMETCHTNWNDCQGCRWC